MTWIVVMAVQGRADLDAALEAVSTLPDGGGVLALDLSPRSGAEAIPSDQLGRLDELVRVAAAAGWRPHLLSRSPPPHLPQDVCAEQSLADCLAAVAPPDARSFEVRLTLPARLEYLSPTRKHLAASVRLAHGDAEAFQVEILVDELCLNAVENSPSSNCPYDLFFRFQGHELLIDVTNLFDSSLEPERIMHRRIESFDDSGGYLGERGRGLFLIARIADGLQIRSLDGDRIRVTVTKRLRGPRAPAPAGRALGLEEQPGGAPVGSDPEARPTES